MKSFVWAGILRAEVRFQLLPRLLFAGLLFLLAPLLFGCSALDAQAAAAPLECFLSLTGTVLLTPLFLPEGDEGIRQTVEARAVSPVRVYLLRLALGIALLAALLGGFVLLLRCSESEAGLAHFLAAFGDGVFLGGLGLFVLALSRNIALSYMAPLALFALNFTLPDDKLGPFALFTLYRGAEGGSLLLDKLVLLGMGLLLIAGALGVREVWRRR